MVYCTGNCPYKDFLMAPILCCIQKYGENEATSAQTQGASREIWGRQTGYVKGDDGPVFKRKGESSAGMSSNAATNAFFPCFLLGFNRDS